MAITNKLKTTTIVIAWAGKDFISSNLLAPRYWEIIEEIALLIWPKTQTNIEIKAPTIPTAAKDSVALFSIFPMIAVSVIESSGSAIPATNAGIASLLIFLKLMSVFKSLQKYYYYCS